MSREITSSFEYRVGGSIIRIGRFSYGVEKSEILQWNEGACLDVSSFCSVARGVTFVLGGNHRSDWVTTFPFGHIFTDELGGNEITGHPSTNGDISIGHDVWIGSRATIMSGVRIGDGAIVAANAHVVKDIAPYEIWGGNPARKIKDRFPQELRDMLLVLQWWTLELEQIREIAPRISAAPNHSTLKELLHRYRPETVNTDGTGCSQQRNVLVQFRHRLSRMMNFAGSSFL
ncbi:CatB-related O-acetyltransferase [Ensifer canadensis]